MEQVQVWFQDETRMGQQGSLSRLWARKGTRPRVVRQQQFMYQYIFGAVCPEEKLAAAIIAPSANSVTMQIHLDEISLHIQEGKHGVVIMDQASWHINQLLRLPKNMSVLHLAPYSPELNAQEPVWRVLKDRFLNNRVYQIFRRNRRCRLSCVEFLDTKSTRNRFTLSATAGPNYVNYFFARINHYLVFIHRT